MKWAGVLSGEARGVGAGLMRAALRGIEPAYATVMRVRNGLYDAGVLRSHDLGRAVISVGNLTTGGTGKTPMVHWVVRRLREQGRCPAVLLRGYGRRDDPQMSDEATLLRALLGPETPVHAGPDRVAGAAKVLGEHPQVDCFVLDDGFQHRRARRQFDLLLVSAANPFGYGHVLPRGLLREPVVGARRADAIVITHVEQATEDELKVIRSRLPDRPTFLARHVLEDLKPLAGIPYLIFSAIGDPGSFEKQVSAQLGAAVARERFDDHHGYTTEDVAALRRAAREVGARAMLTTQKDFVKLKALAENEMRDDAMAMIRPVNLDISLSDGDSDKLTRMMLGALERS